MGLKEAYNIFLAKENLNDSDALQKAFNSGCSFGKAEMEDSFKNDELYDDLEMKQMEEEIMEDEFDFELDDSVSFEDLI